MSTRQKVYTAKEVCKILNISYPTLRKWDENIRPAYMSNRRRYTQEMLDQALEKSRKESSN